MKKNFYLDTFEKYYSLNNYKVDIKNIEKILTNLCHIQDLLNINVNVLSDFFGNFLKDYDNKKIIEK